LDSTPTLGSQPLLSAVYKRAPTVTFFCTNHLASPARCTLPPPRRSRRTLIAFMLFLLSKLTPPPVPVPGPPVPVTGCNPHLPLLPASAPSSLGMAALRASGGWRRSTRSQQEDYQPTPSAHPAHPHPHPRPPTRVSGHGQATLARPQALALRWGGESGRARGGRIGSQGARAGSCPLLLSH
jgi:hypothetical protein